MESKFVKTIDMISLYRQLIRRWKIYAVVLVLAGIAGWSLASPVKQWQQSNMQLTDEEITEAENYIAYEKQLSLLNAQQDELLQNMMLEADDEGTTVQPEVADMEEFNTREDFIDDLDTYLQDEYSGFSSSVQGYISQVSSNSLGSSVTTKEKIKDALLAGIVCLFLSLFVQIEWYILVGRVKSARDILELTNIKTLQSMKRNMLFAVRKIKLGEADRQRLQEFLQEKENKVCVLNLGNSIVSQESFADHMMTWEEYEEAQRQDAVYLILEAGKTKYIDILRIQQKLGDKIVGGAYLE